MDDKEQDNDFEVLDSEQGNKFEVFDRDELDKILEYNEDGEISILADGDETITSSCLVINPRGNPVDKNPLCPDCKEEIIPVTNDLERRFMCGCDDVRQFSFESKE